MEKFINNKATEMINDLRHKMISRGIDLTSEQEYFIRVGMGYGLSLAGLALNNLPADVTLEKGKY